MSSAPASAPPPKPPPRIARTQQSPVWGEGGSSRPPPRKRNIPLLIVGGVLVVVAFGFGGLFAQNMQTYMQPEAKAARAATLRRLLVFGPAAGVAVVPGVVLLIVSLRRRGG